jgi:hypothetical protein
MGRHNLLSRSAGHASATWLRNGLVTKFSHHPSRTDRLPTCSMFRGQPSSTRRPSSATARPRRSRQCSKERRPLVRSLATSTGAALRLGHELDRPIWGRSEAVFTVAGAEIHLGWWTAAPIAPEPGDDLLESRVADPFREQADRDYRGALAAAYLQLAVRPVGEAVISAKWRRVHAVRTTREHPAVESPAIRRDANFHDAGGPAARHAIRLQARGFSAWWRRTSAGKLFLLGLAIGFGVPMAILIGGLVIAYIVTGGR